MFCYGTLRMKDIKATTRLIVDYYRKVKKRVCRDVDNPVDNKTLFLRLFRFKYSNSSGGGVFSTAWASSSGVVGMDGGKGYSTGRPCGRDSGGLPFTSSLFNLRLRFGMIPPPFEVRIIENENMYRLSILG